MSDAKRLGLTPSPLDTQRIVPITPDTDLETLLQNEDAQVAQYLRAMKFTGKPGSLISAMDSAGQLVHFTGIKSFDDMYAIADLPQKLGAGSYALSPKTEADLTAEQQTKLTLGWSLGSYTFDKFKSEKNRQAITPPPCRNGYTCGFPTGRGRLYGA